MANDTTDKRADLLERLKKKRTEEHVQPNQGSLAFSAKQVDYVVDYNALEQQADGPLFALARAMHMIEPGQGRQMQQLCDSNSIPTEEQRRFLDSLEKDAQVLCKLLLVARNKEVEEPKLVDMRLCLWVSKDGLAAWAFVLPPIHGGAVLTQEQILKQLAAENVQYGVDLTALGQSLEQGICMKLIVVANGLAAVNGVDGQVIDRFARGKEIHLQAEHDAMDYRNLHWLQNIHAEEVICDLVQPTAAVDGMSVHGMRIGAKSGRMPTVPVGVNTTVNPEKTALLATCEGQLNFVGGTFRVDQILRIKGDIDTAVGNLDVLGDLEISGNVGDGYFLRATGNMVVRGLVEGAHLEAGGNVQVMLGVKGNGKGTITAKGDIVCKYLENAQVVAGKTVKADSIINSKVSSGDTVTAVTGRGVIIGGTVLARNCIEAKHIGNDANRATTLVVGADPAIFDKLPKLKIEIDAKRREIEEMKRNIVYLENNSNKDKNYQALLSQLKLKYSVVKMAGEKKQKQYDSLKAQLEYNGGQVIATTLYPQTVVEICGMRYFARTASHMCRIYMEDGEIKVGVK